MILPNLPRAIRWSEIADWLASRLPPVLAVLAVVVLLLQLVTGVWP